jgi:adenosylcobyric acid synthase
MNPVLLKPQGPQSSQLIIQGKVHSSLNAQEYYSHKLSLLSHVTESFQKIQHNTDLILVEGAGSPAETNLRKNDIANMGFACHVQAPVILLGDIHRGGVIASLIGTHALLSPIEQKLVKGFIINKFKGNPDLFSPALLTLSQQTSWESLGILPWFQKASQLPAEDSMALESPEKSFPTSESTLHIAVPLCPHIANFDDIDPLRLEPHVQVSLVKPHNPIPKNTHVIIIPGSKNTSKDLAFMRAQGWDIDILAHARQNTWIVGICGGFQMLGQTLHDPHHIESSQTLSKGLGLLPVSTTLSHHKKLSLSHGICSLNQQKLSGYEIHMGLSSYTDSSPSPFAHIGDNQKPEGACLNHIIGTYLHGIFAHDSFRQHMISLWKNNQDSQSTFSYPQHIDNTLNDLASHIETHLNVDHILSLARPCP